jgi:hypothetical protein
MVRLCFLIRLQPLLASVGIKVVCRRASCRGIMTATRWTGLAAIIGGLCWVLKGVVIMLIGEQPPYVFEVAPVFFALAAAGLYVRLQGRGGRTALIGLYAAFVSGLLAVTDIALYAMGAVGEATEDTFSPTTFGSFLALITSLILLGIPHMKATRLSPTWRSLPLAIGILTIPLVGIGAALEAFDHRLFELPIVCWEWRGCCWDAASSLTLAK